MIRERSRALAHHPRKTADPRADKGRGVMVTALVFFVAWLVGAAVLGRAPSDRRRRKR
jgi:hypothetical protein